MEEVEGVSIFIHMYLLSYGLVLEAAVKSVNMILLEAAEMPNMNLDSVTEEMVMSTCLPILMEAVCVLNMILLMMANQLWIKIYSQIEIHLF